MTGRVLVTPRSVTSGPGLELLGPLKEAGLDVVLATSGRHPTRDELVAALPGCVGYLAGTERIDDTVLASTDTLRVISRNGTGVDNIDLHAAELRGVTVVRAIGANARGVAELAFTLILDGLRRVTLADRSLRAGTWERPTGRELPGRRLGLVGFGAIGRIVGDLATGCRMDVVAFDPYLGHAHRQARGVSFVTSLEAVLTSCDLVSLHCPATPTGVPLIGASELSLMEPGAVLVNTARWSLVDAAAVAKALDDGRLSVYATDTFASEPPGDDPLVSHPRTIVTPHLGGLTHESVTRATQAAVENLLSALDPGSRGA